MKVNLLFVLLILISFSSEILSEIDSGLVSTFRFNEGIVDTTWASGIGYPIYNTGLVPWATGKYGFGLHFNNNTYIQVNNSSFQIDTLTISVWIKLDTITETSHGFYQGHDMTIVEYNGGYKLAVYNDGTPYFQTSVYNCDPWYEERTRLVSTVKLVANTWAHIVAISNGNGQELYIDGSFVGSQVNPGPIRNCGGNTFSIGKHPVNFDPEYFKGFIDELCIYNRALVTSEISELCKLKSMCKYTFNESNGDTLFDSSGNLYKHILKNNPIWVTDTINGRPAKVMEFNGINAHTELLERNENFNFGTRDFSFSLWFKTSFMGGAASDFLLSKSEGDGTDHQFFLFYKAYTDGHLVMYNRTGNALSWAETNFSVADGQWHHAVGVRDSTIFTLWLDNTIVASCTSATLIGLTGAGKVMIGGRVPYWNDPFFNGRIEDVRIFDCALDSTSVNSLYNDCSY